jgi:AcrR family transcriptional regulator
MLRGQQTERGRSARQRILDAAEPLFAERGLYGASVRDLARAAGMPTASLLHHFGRKEAVYGAVLDRIARDLERRLARALVDGEPWPRRLRHLLAGFAEFARRHPTRANLLLREILDNPGRLERVARFPLVPLFDRIARFLAAGRRAGAFQPIDPEIFVAHLAGSVSYFTAAAPTFARIAPRARPAARARRHTDHLVALLERAVLAPKAPP